MSSTTQNVTQYFVDWGNTTEPGDRDAQPDGVPGQQRRPGLQCRHGAVVLGPLRGSLRHRQLARSRPQHAAGDGEPVRRHGCPARHTPDRPGCGRQDRSQQHASDLGDHLAAAGHVAAKWNPVTITGTAHAAAGAFVVGVEVSTDGGQTWNPAQGTTNWSFSWTPGATGPVTIESRAVDDTVNLGPPSAGVTVTVTTADDLADHLRPGGDAHGSRGERSQLPPSWVSGSPSDVSGYITGIRFYKGPGNTGTHIGNLWTSTGTLLATVTFTDETASGWQEADFSTPVAITAGTTYVASYYAPAGDYAADTFYFALSGVNSGPLHVGSGPAQQSGQRVPPGLECLSDQHLRLDELLGRRRLQPDGHRGAARDRAFPRRRAPTGSRPTPTSPPGSTNRSRWARSHSFSPTPMGTSSRRPSVTMARRTPPRSRPTPRCFYPGHLHGDDQRSPGPERPRDDELRVLVVQHGSYQPGSAYTLWGNSVKPTDRLDRRRSSDRGRRHVRIDAGRHIAGIRFYDGDLVQPRWRQLATVTAARTLTLFTSGPPPGTLWRPPTTP